MGCRALSAGAQNPVHEHRAAHTPCDSSLSHILRRLPALQREGGDVLPLTSACLLRVNRAWTATLPLLRDGPGAQTREPKQRPPANGLRDAVPRLTFAFIRADVTVEAAIMSSGVLF